jgi:hypothetical protein
MRLGKTWQLIKRQENPQENALLGLLVVGEVIARANHSMIS